MNAIWGENIHIRMGTESKDLKIKEEETKGIRKKRTKMASDKEYTKKNGKTQETKYLF